MHLQHTYTRTPPATCILFFIFIFPAPRTSGTRESAALPTALPLDDKSADQAILGDRHYATLTQGHCRTPATRTPATETRTSAPPSPPSAATTKHTWIPNETSKQLATNLHVVQNVKEYAKTGKITAFGLTVGRHSNMDGLDCGKKMKVDILKSQLAMKFTIYKSV